MTKKEVATLSNWAHRQQDHPPLIEAVQTIPDKDPASLMCKDALRALIDRITFLNEDGPLSLVYEQHAKTLFAYALMVAP